MRSVLPRQPCTVASPAPTLPPVVNFGPPQTIAGPRSGRRTAAHRLLTQPLKDLTGHVAPLDMLFGPGADPLVDDLACARDCPARFRRIDRFLLERLPLGAQPAPEVARAWQLIVASRGGVRVGQLAAACGWSQRHLTARFTQALGLSPKVMARLVRFHHAAVLLSRPAAGGLAEVAAAAGYYDQPHFCSEVRSFSGLTPQQLLARRLPDGGGVFDLP